MNHYFFLRIIILSFAFLLLTSGIIRPDVDQKQYEMLAAEKQFNCVGEVYFDSQFNGSCVLINEKYVLTATHMFIKYDTKPDTLNYNGQTIVNLVPYNFRLADKKSIEIRFNDQAFKVKRIVIDPECLNNDSKESFDLALIELETECTVIKPAKLNTEFSELNSNVVGTGYGQFGVANHILENSNRMKIAGQNVVDSLGGHLHDGKYSLMFCDLDHPSDHNFNKMGSPSPRPLEYLCAPGDSGGGLFMKRNDDWLLIGICRGSRTNIQEVLKSGYYGQTMRWTRVSAFNNWIKDNLE